MEVVQVISDTEIIIKKEVKEAKALALLTSPEGSAYKCIPHVEQDSVYKSVHDELNNNQCITIFPEGGSHDRAEMLPFKGTVKLFFFALFVNNPRRPTHNLYFVFLAGVTLMALGAMAKYPGLDVKIVPCGMC